MAAAGHSYARGQYRVVHSWERASLAPDIWDCADGLGLTKVHLLGRAFGNRVVRTASSDQPNLVLSVILLAAGGEVVPAPEDSRNLVRAFDAAIDTN